jgi:hypothetical protein
MPLILTVKAIQLLQQLAQMARTARQPLELLENLLQLQLLILIWLEVQQGLKVCPDMVAAELVALGLRTKL